MLGHHRRTKVVKIQVVQSAFVHLNTFGIDYFDFSKYEMFFVLNTVEGIFTSFCFLLDWLLKSQSDWNLFRRSAMFGCSHQVTRCREEGEIGPWRVESAGANFVKAGNFKWVVCW